MPEAISVSGFFCRSFMNYSLANHLLERASERGISETIIREILANPEQIVDDESSDEGQKVFQSVIRVYQKYSVLSTNLREHDNGAKRCKVGLQNIENQQVL